MPQISQRVYTVGRLDEDSEGLLLLTNDGDLANRLMHPRFGVEKAYLVHGGRQSGGPTIIKKLLEGVCLSEGHVKARQVKRLKRQGNSTWLRIVLAEGKNREIRRMLAKLDHKVLRLKRIAIGPLEIGNLTPGKSRPLNVHEIKSIKRLAEKRQACRSPRGTGNSMSFQQYHTPVIDNFRIATNTYLIRLHGSGSCQGDSARTVRDDPLAEQRPIPCWAGRSRFTTCCR